MKFNENSASKGETNAIANIGNLTITGTIQQIGSNQDISNSKISILGLKNSNGVITANPTISSLIISYSNANLNDLTDLTNISFEMSGAGSSSISGITNITTYSK